MKCHDLKSMSLVLAAMMMLGAPMAQAASSDCPTGGVKELTGAGATFPFPLYSKMFDEYNKLCAVKVNYQSIGSGGGIQQINQMTVDFGASDGIMTDQQLAQAKGGPILHIPMTAGAEAITYNLSGIPERDPENDARCAGRHLSQKDQEME